MPFTIVNFRDVRRAMSRTPSKLAQLTRDGLVYDHVHYRWNRAGVEDVLDAGDRKLPAGLRTPGTAMVMVSIRVWDDDVDMIEVFDPETGTYHEMWSTEPEYTSGLSRWEHHQYLAMMRAGGNGAITEENRLLQKGRSLRAQDEILPTLPFRERAVGAALVEGESYRRASGARAKRAGFADVPELGATMSAGGGDREDMPTTPPQPATKRGTRTGRGSIKPRHRAPPRDPQYGRASRPRPDADTQHEANSDRDESDRAARERLDRWAALGAAVGSEARAVGAVEDEPEGAPRDGSAIEYHLREDDHVEEDESGDAVSYGEDEEQEVTET